MKKHYPVFFTCSILLTTLGFSFSPLSKAVEKKADDVLIKLTFQVDMKYQEVHPNGVFIVCNILNGDNQTRMEQTSASIWAITIDAPIGYEVLWRFVNGPDNFEPTADMETCGIGSSAADSVRTHITASVDEVLPAYCFGQCETCDLINASKTASIENAVSLFPNPATDLILVKYAFDAPINMNLNMRDVSGRLVLSSQLKNITKGQSDLPLNGLPAGLYWIDFTVKNQRNIKKILIKNNP